MANQQILSNCIYNNIRSVLILEDDIKLEKIIAQLETKAHNPNSGMEGMVAYGHSTQNQHSPMVPPPNRNAPGVLLVDDSNLILTNISRALLHEGYRVILAKNGLEALQKLEQAQSPQSSTGVIHAILTDVEMPQMDGISFIRKVREQKIYDKIPVYMHTSLGDASSKQQGEKAGANGYFVKNDVQTITETLRRHFMNLKTPA